MLYWSMLETSMLPKSMLHIIGYGTPKSTFQCHNMKVNSVRFNDTYSYINTQENTNAPLSLLMQPMIISVYNKIYNIGRFLWLTRSWNSRIKLEQHRSISEKKLTVVYHELRSHGYVPQWYKNLHIQTKILLTASNLTPTLTQGQKNPNKNNQNYNLPIGWRSNSYLFTEIFMFIYIHPMNCNVKIWNIRKSPTKGIGIFIIKTPKTNIIILLWPT